MSGSRLGTVAASYGTGLGLIGRSRVALKKRSRLYVRTLGLLISRPAAV
jgi:hypothetical protein